MESRSRQLGALAILQVEKQMHEEVHKEDKRRRRRLKRPDLQLRAIEPDEVVLSSAAEAVSEG